jgi:hypothetical protein
MCKFSSNLGARYWTWIKTTQVRLCLNHGPKKLLTFSRPKNNRESQKKRKGNMSSSHIFSRDRQGSPPCFLWSDSHETRFLESFLLRYINIFWSCPIRHLAAVHILTWKTLHLRLAYACCFVFSDFASVFSYVSNRLHIALNTDLSLYTVPLTIYPRLYFLFWGTLLQK